MGVREAEPQLLITVTRSGGFGGIMRTWTARVREADADDWRPLVRKGVPTEATPGSASDGDAMPRSNPPTPAGADRFVWTVRVRDGQDKRSLRCSEADLTDAARDLIDRVRSTPGSAGRSAVS